MTTEAKVQEQETSSSARASTEQSGLRDQENAMRDVLTDDIVAPPAIPELATETAAIVEPESAASPPPTPSAMLPPPPLNALAPASSDRSRLFIVCGRGRKPDELRQLFSECGEIKNLHFALDRSNKSRGFAFLQYKDPSCAVTAIEKFHLMTLEDGHVLKVTVAKDKPVVAVGKLKRNQQSSHDVHSESESNVEEPHIPGKRQRSSAPVSSHAAAPRRKMRVGDTVDGLFDKSSFAEMQHRVISTPSEPTISSEKEVASVLEDILLTVQSSGNTGSIGNLMAGYSLIAEHRRQTLIAVSSGNGRSEALDDGGKKIEADKSHEQEETSTEQLTSSINSFTLDGTPTISILPCEKLKNNLLSSIGAPSSSVHRKRAAKVSLLRRSRQSFDDSDSSADGGESDATPSRRKRSNISRREPSSWFTRGEHADSHILPVPLRSSHLLTPVKSKKQCKRQSSDQSADVSTRLSKQRVTSTRSSRTAAFSAMALTSGGIPSIPTSKSSTSRTKLFFTSSHKFTMQELEAMFVVYGDFEFVDIVKSFGRVKTMAYVKYSNPQTASAVIESFQEEHEQEAEHAGQGEFMKLSFAEDNRRNAASPFLHMSQLDQNASFSHMLQPPAGAAARMTPLPIETMGEKLWLLILYDRSLPSNVISACVSKCVGMEFVDIKVFRSTGEAQGVAFVKFESEAQAVDASHELHQTELPTGSGKFLQAIVIQDPSLFSTMHGGPHGVWSSEHGGGGEGGDDVDLSAVEVKFAHLMRSNDQNGNLSAGHGRSRMSIDETSAPTARAALQHPAALTYLPGPAAASFFGAMPLHSMQPQLQLQYPQHGYGYYPQHQQHQQPFVAQTQHGQPYEYVPSPWPSESPLPSSYYNTSYPSPQMAYPPPPEYYNQQQAYPAQAVYPVATNGDENTGATILETDSPPTTGASSDSSADGVQLSPPAICISSGRPLELISVVKALEDCSGVVAITKDGEDSDAVFVVEFTDSPLAADAVKKLDGNMCNGKKLHVVTMSSSVGGKPRAASSRRKRQRVDPRTRK